MQFQACAKSFKQAVTTLIDDVKNNRCMALAVRDAINGLRLQDTNALMVCIHRHNSRATYQNLIQLLNSIVEVVVIADEDGKEIRLNCGTDGEHAIETLKSFKLRNIAARIEIQ